MRRVLLCLVVAAGCAGGCEPAKRPNDPPPPPQDSGADKNTRPRGKDPENLEAPAGTDKGTPAPPKTP